MTLDFRNCKTPEDVQRVFEKNKPQLDALRNEIDTALKNNSTDPRKDESLAIEAENEMSYQDMVTENY